MLLDILIFVPILMCILFGLRDGIYENLSQSLCLLPVSFWGNYICVMLVIY